MVRISQDGDTTLTSSSANEPTAVAGTPQPLPSVPPHQKGTPWAVWLIITGLFLLVCLASAAALLLFSRRIDTRAMPNMTTFVPFAIGAPATSPSEAMQISASSGAAVVGTPAATPLTDMGMAGAPSLSPLPAGIDMTALPTTASLPLTSSSILTTTTPELLLIPDLSPTPTVSTAAAGADNIIAAVTPPLVPRLGMISFSAVTQDGRTIEGDTFTGKITEIHAIFTYQNMVDGLPWERRWYLNGRQMTKVTDIWNKGNAGTFHLTLTAGGSPLGSGRWRLELYVNGELLQQGEFIIEALPTPILSPAPTPLPTFTPLSTPSATVAPAETPTPIAVPVYTIAFSRWDGGKYDLYVVRTDGSGERFLLQRAAGPSWSPDGRYLIFYGQEGVDRQERDGITRHFEGISNGIISLDMRTWSPDLSTLMLRQHVREATARWAAWSPRGDMVAYDARRGGPDWRIYFVGTADNQQHHVEIPGEQADWSPDGNYLVYRSGRDNRQGIWVSNRDDSSRVQITAEGSDAFPRWSPDGRKIAFHRDSGQNVDIYVMNPDGSHVRRLTDAPGPDTLPAWTPDGRIVFRSARSGSWGIYIMNADSSGQRLVIPNADPGPDWAFGRMDVR